MRAGSCGYIPSCQAPKAVASRGPGVGNAYMLREAPGTFDRESGSLPRVDKRGGRGRQVVNSRLPTLIVGWRSDGVDYFQG
jgi:hypothetical protein